MPSFGKFRRVDLARCDVSEESAASIIRVTRIDELRSALAVTSNRRKLRRNDILVVTANVPSTQIFVTLMMEAIHSTETLALTRATQRNISEDDILHGRRRENSKS
jgi:hypothetical protein